MEEDVLIPINVPYNSISVVKWTSRSNVANTTRIFTRHLSPFTDDVVMMGGRIDSVTQED
jgi:hypothetical protein